MKRITRSLVACWVLAAALLATVAPARAEQQPSSEVLLPYFEVNLQNASAANTFFAVGNSLDKPVGVEITIYTNWGIQIAKSNLTLAARQVRNFNLRNWLAGDLPDRKLSTAELNHFKAALSGQRSPKDKFFYASQIAPGLAVGYVRVKTLGQPQPDALWGDYFLLDPGQGSAEGDTLINLDPTTGCAGGCKRHALRFVTTGTFDAGTQIVIVSDVAAKPSKTAQPAGLVQADTLAFDEAGQALGGNRLSLLPVQVISAADLGLRQPAGWIDLETEATSYVAVHYSSKKSFGVALMSYCLPPGNPAAPGLLLQKLTNGLDANLVPGPMLKIGSPVLWEYIVENTGDLRLTDIEVSDDDTRLSVSCPKTELAPGERMTCTAHGTAEACQYVNVGTATALTADGQSLSVDDASHYFGDENAAIDVELLVNGKDADSLADELTVNAGAKIDWTYIVTNKGDVTLNEIKVSDDKGNAVSCPKGSLRPGESMTCAVSGGEAASGQVVKMGSASAKTTCGEVRDEDPGYYEGKPPDIPQPPGISIKKLTNNDDCAAAPGRSLSLGSAVRWDYIVTNIGKIRLDNIQVKDDKEGAVACPKTSLQPDESMTCAKTGVARVCQYSNTGTVTASSSDGKAATSSDTSWYFGQSRPALQIKTWTNGQDGAKISAGAPVQWTYQVTNSGDVALRDVRVTDDKLGAVSCPKTSLQPGESMTCSAGGTAASGPHSNVGTVKGTADTLCGGDASASDPSSYEGVNGPPPCNGKPSLTELWPPNHKMVDIQVLGIVDPNGDPVTIKITGITQDEPVEEKGDGNTGPDGAGVGTSTAQVRAERSGLEDGRVYEIHYSATDNQGAACTGSVFVGVPHDQRGTPPVDSGQYYDSTVAK
jgi:hypothetical protein